jgi:mannose-1-phosphate guanylyltransferase
VIPVVLSGGAGTRLWPASRADRPKQFLRLVGQHTMVQATLRRAAALDAGSPLVVANVTQAELVATELRAAGVDPDRMILEPFGRNTAPAAAAAALVLRQRGDDPLMLLLPADHAIDDTAAFVEAARRGCDLAASGHLVTFGIVPSRAETGYGYIRAGEPIGDVGHRVAEFVEKPDPTTAERYLQDGGYLWNSGMFVFRCSDYLAALGEFAPEMLAACEATVAASPAAGRVELDPTTFETVPADSIDYAVMEHTSRAVVVPMDAGWNDVGSWAAMWDITPKDESGNATSGDVMTTAASNCFIRSEHRLVAVAGIDNVVVVETPDAVLVTSRENSQAVKVIVEMLNEADRTEADRPHAPRRSETAG